MELEAVFLFAMQNGYFDDIAVNKVREFQAGMGEFFETRKADVLDNIRNNKPDLKKDATAVAAVKQAIEDFKSSWK
jgi:F-type H+-transporting ATPase subunit alpha